jgi:hypothetical protein
MIGQRSLRLGFPCHNVYTNSVYHYYHRDFGVGYGPSAYFCLLSSSIAKKLKGRDGAVARAAHEAGLRVYIQPIVDSPESGYHFVLPRFMDEYETPGKKLIDHCAAGFSGVSCVCRNTDEFEWENMRVSDLARTWIEDFLDGARCHLFKSP